MIIACPECQKKLRISTEKYAGKKLALNCRNCGQRFPCYIPPAVKILIAHGEPEVCRTLLDICSEDISDIISCKDAAAVRSLLAQQSFSVLLLDVALPGAFLFELIEEVQRNAGSVRIVLLPSVYNSAAYKRKPSSLYGADAYLELHHLSDRLIPLLHQLVPDLSLKSVSRYTLEDEELERSLPIDSSPNEQAEELARMLVADIALYHQDQIDLGIVEQNLEVRLAEQLREGRRMMSLRISQAELDQQDYLLAALNAFAQARAKEIAGTKGDRHE